MALNSENAGERQVLDACDRLVDFAAWPRGKVEYRAWLGNFDPADRQLAVSMLSSFTFLSHQLVDQLFVSAFQSISSGLCRVGTASAERLSAWDRFYDEVIVVPVMGETPNPADSGWVFARKARQLLGVSEKRLLQPRDAVAAMAEGATLPIVFVDDFVGSGDQFLRTWTRVHNTSKGPCSFASLSARCRSYYCNVMMTAYGRDRIRRHAPTVALATGNLIPPNHNFCCMGSAMWPKGMNVRGAELVRRVGRRLGYTKSDGGLRDWRGYHRLGLGVAMEDSVPDANLPLFFEDANGWQPLVRRA